MRKERSNSNQLLTWSHLVDVDVDVKIMVRLLIFMNFILFIAINFNLL